MSLTIPGTYLVSAVAYDVDASVRTDLVKSFIKDEPDYVSNLTVGIRDYWRNRGLAAYCHSQLLSGSHEGTFGCDVIIVVRHNNKAKVCLFEAKFPRLSTSGYRWDSMQTSANISHFTHQLRRQARWSHVAAIWELFIVEHAVGSQPQHFDQYASTCVLHEEAYRWDSTYRKAADKWTQDDVKQLVANVRQQPKNIRTMLERACRCSEGRYLEVSNGAVALISEDQDPAEVAVPAEVENLPEVVPAFCEENGIEHFLFVRLDESEGEA